MRIKVKSFDEIQEIMTSKGVVLDEAAIAEWRDEMCDKEFEATEERTMFGQTYVLKIGGIVLIDEATVLEY